MMKRVTVEQKGSQEWFPCLHRRVRQWPAVFLTLCSLAARRLHTGDSDTYDHRTAWLGYRLILLLTRDALYATSDGAI